MAKKDKEKEQKNTPSLKVLKVQINPARADLQREIK